MTRQDWLTAFVIMAGVAAVTVGLIAPPVCRAANSGVIAIPALPPSQLTIPTIKAKVMATATPEPGKSVKVKLALQSPWSVKVLTVPVTVTVLGTTMNLMSRVGPLPGDAKVVTKVTTSLLVGPNGCASTIVALPLTWAIPTPPATSASGKPKPVLRSMMVTSYQMVLSSPLGGQAAPAGLQIVPAVIRKRTN